eukprot:6549466-Alexandrium_andersonii.AAC.1
MPWPPLMSSLLDACPVLTCMPPPAVQRRSSCGLILGTFPLTSSEMLRWQRAHDSLLFRQSCDDRRACHSPVLKPAPESIHLVAFLGQRGAPGFHFAPEGVSPGPAGAPGP